MFQVRLLGQFDLRADGKRVLVPSRSGQSLFAYLVLNTGTEHRREKLAGMIWPDVSDDVARKNLRQELWRIRKAITTQSPSDGDALIADEFLVSFEPSPQFWLDVEQLERAPEEIDGLLSAISLYRGELLPGFYDEWVILERDRVQALFEARCGLALEQLTQAQQWKQVQEWAERWIALGQTPEPAYRALMIAAAAQGDSGKLAVAYERCAEALKNDVGVEPSGETRDLFQRLSQGENAAPQMLKLHSPVLIQPSGTVTFLFTDIEGSTKLLERLGNEYANVLADQRDILRELAEKYNGHEVDTQGDAFFFAFFRAADAVSFATDAQRALAAHEWQNGERLRVRMGLHTGEPMLARTGYVGMDVHRAARIGAAGHGGQVLLSQTTSTLVANVLPDGTHLDDLGEHRLKDLRYPVHIVQLTIADLPSDFPPLKAFDNAVEPPAPGEAPFKGLEFFDQTDASLFFGREQLVEKLARTIRAQNFLAVVVGASGSGKSSVVRAGLIPALTNSTHYPVGEPSPRTANSGGWRVFVMTPTAHPLEALAVELTRGSESVTATATLLDDLAHDPRALQLYVRRHTTDDSQTLLVVDQFEELFTLCHDDFEREQFIDCLLDAVNVGVGDGATRSQLLTLVLTIRADFYAHLAQYPELREAVAKQQEYIGPMNSEELRRAILEPATRGGWTFEPGLVDLILRDVGEEPGALPLLSHALLETWKRRSGHTMRLKGYADSGGVQGAISHTAETTYQQLTPEQQAITRDIFLRLTELGEGTEDTRRRAKFQELESGNATPGDVRKVLTLLADARLITTGERTAEVAHEALIREWTRLREWLDENRDGLKLHRNLTDAAHEWELMERDAGVLYRGARLAQAQEFAETNPNALNAQERVFLDASLENERRETREREEQQRRELEAAQTLVATQTRAAKQLRQRAIFLAGAFLLAIVLAGVALLLGDSANRNSVAAQENATAAQQSAAQAERNASEAEAAKLTAEREQRTATARELAASAIANLEVDPERSVLLALQAVDATRKVDGTVLREAEEALHRAVQTLQVFHTFTDVKQPDQATFSPDGSLLAVRGNGVISIRDVISGRQLQKMPISPDYTDHLVFSADGKRLATVDLDSARNNIAKVFDLQTGTVLSEISLPIPHDRWSCSAINSDLTRIVVGETDGTATVWDMETGKLVLTLSGHTENVEGVAYSLDGTRIATASIDKTAKIWDATSGKELLTLRGHSNPLLDIVFSPDGKHVGTGSQDQTAKIWDAATGDELLTLAHITWVNGIAFSPDSSRVATAGGVGNVTVWDANTGKELFLLAGHKTSVISVNFSPDAKRLASTSVDGTVKIWDITPNHEVFTFPTEGVSDPLIGEANAAYSPDGKYLAVGLTNGKIKVWDAKSGEEVMVLGGHAGSVHKIAYSHDGTRLASASNDKTAKIWEMATGKNIVTLAGHDDVVIAVDWSPDDTHIVTGSQDKTVKIWDARTGQVLTTLSEGIGAFYAVAISPDGTRLAASNVEDYQIFVGQLFLWDLATGKLIYSQKNPFVDHLVFSPDGTRLAVASPNSPKILDATTGKSILTMEGPIPDQFWLAYSADGTRLATANGDGTAVVFDAVNGESLLTLNVGKVSVRGVGFSPDGSQLATADDEAVRVFLLDIEDLVALAKTRVTRSLSPEECNKYLHVDSCPTE